MAADETETPAPDEQELPEIVFEDIDIQANREKMERERLFEYNQQGAEQEQREKAMLSNDALRRALGLSDDPWDSACVLIAKFCSWTHVAAQFMDCMEKLEKPSRWAQYRIRDNTAMSNMRNAAVRAMLGADPRQTRGPITHVFMVDVDMIYPHDTLPRLVRHDVDVVAGLATCRIPVRSDHDGSITFPHTFGLPGPLEYNYHYDTHLPTPPGLYKCGKPSGGGVLIKRQVFEQMEEPWFDEGLKVPKPDGTISRVSEDVYFFTKCARYGLGVYCDTQLLYGHMIEAAVYPAMGPDGQYRFDVRLV